MSPGWTNLEDSTTAPLRSNSPRFSALRAWLREETRLKFSQAKRSIRTPSVSSGTVSSMAMMQCVPSRKDNRRRTWNTRMDTNRTWVWRVGRWNSQGNRPRRWSSQKDRCLLWVWRAGHWTPLSSRPRRWSNQKDKFLLFQLRIVRSFQGGSSFRRWSSRMGRYPPYEPLRQMDSARRPAWWS